MTDFLYFYNLLPVPEIPEAPLSKEITSYVKDLESASYQLEADEDGNIDKSDLDGAINNVSQLSGADDLSWFAEVTLEEYQTLIDKIYDLEDEDLLSDLGLPLKYQHISRYLTKLSAPSYEFLKQFNTKWMFNGNALIPECDKKISIDLKRVFSNCYHISLIWDKEKELKRDFTAIYKPTEEEAIMYKLQTGKNYLIYTLLTTLPKYP
jgi:hypothetical protein